MLSTKKTAFVNASSSRHDQQKKPKVDLKKLAIKLTGCIISVNVADRDGTANGMKKPALISL